jgi:hypothetical protein
MLVLLLLHSWCKFYYQFDVVLLQFWHYCYCALLTRDYPHTWHDLYSIADTCLLIILTHFNCYFIARFVDLLLLIYYIFAANLLHVYCIVRSWVYTAYVVDVCCSFSSNFLLRYLYFIVFTITFDACFSSQLSFDPFICYNYLNILTQIHDDVSTTLKKIKFDFKWQADQVMLIIYTPINYTTRYWRHWCNCDLVFDAIVTWCLTQFWCDWDARFDAI